MGQGLAPRDWFGGQTAGTWYCHEMRGPLCQDQTRIQCDSSTPGFSSSMEAGQGCCKKTGTPGCGGAVTPAPNHMHLHGASDASQYWCRLGRFRTGGGLCFDGQATFGTIAHSEDYNFTSNPMYEAKGMRGGGVNKSSEFTLQMVIHPRSPSSGKAQVLATKPGQFELRINTEGTLDWAVTLNGKVVVATSTTKLKAAVPGVPGGYVVKATHAGGTIKIFVCSLTADFRCSMPTPEGTAHGSLPIGISTENITVGANQDGGAAPTNMFDGGVEEMFLYQTSLEKVNAMLFSCPNTGCVDWYVFDYTNPAARKWWANASASMFNAVGAAVSQWDGNEFQGSIAGWDLPHSDATIGAGTGTNYWGLAKDQASLESRALWKQITAVEGGGGGGLGPWKADMAPFADEATIKGPLCGPGGDRWHEQILLSTLESGMLLNGYHTSLALPQKDFDCFIGGLVATGIAPQMGGTGSPAQLARSKYWLDLFKLHGMATESTITALHYPDIFLVGLRGGTSPTPSYGLYAGNSSTVSLPRAFSDNATVLTYMGVSAKTVSLALPGNVTVVTFFAANAMQLVLTGPFFSGGAVTQTHIVNGTATATEKVPARGSSLHVGLGESARYSRSSASV